MTEVRAQRLFTTSGCAGHVKRLISATRCDTKLCLEWSPCHRTTRILKIPARQSFRLLGIAPATSLVSQTARLKGLGALSTGANHRALHATSGLRLRAGPCTQSDHSGLLTSKPVFNSVLFVKARVRAWSGGLPGFGRGRAAGRRGSEAGEWIPMGTDMQGRT